MERPKTKYRTRKQALSATTAELVREVIDGPGSGVAASVLADRLLEVDSPERVAVLKELGLAATSRWDWKYRVWQHVLSGQRRVGPGRGALDSVRQLRELYRDVGEELLGGLERERCFVVRVKEKGAFAGGARGASLTVEVSPLDGGRFAPEEALCKVVEQEEKLRAEYDLSEVPRPEKPGRREDV